MFTSLGIVFACILLPCSFFITNPPPDSSAKPAGASGDAAPPESYKHYSVDRYLRTPQFMMMWLVFFFNIAAGISVISFQSPLLQDVWGQADPTVEPAKLAEYGAILTAWAAAGIFGPLYVGNLKDRYPDQAVIYCFLIGVVLLGLGYVFSYLLNDERIRLRRPTFAGTMRQFGIVPPRQL